MGINELIEKLWGQLPALSIIITVIWLKLNYLEKKIDALSNGSFRCKEHRIMDDRIIEALKSKKNDTSNK